MLGRLAVGLAAAAFALAAPASATVPGGNLLVNPGAEAAAGSPDAFQIVPPPGWTIESNFTVVQYAAPDFPTAADSAALGGGANFFAGGPTNPASAATQIVNVSGAAPEIDAGKVQANLGAQLGAMTARPIARR